LDIYRPYINKTASEKTTVNVGRLTGLVALIIAMAIAPALGNLGQAFQFIQEYTGIVSPGILAVFIAGLFYKKATNNGAIWGVVLSIPIAFYFKIAPKGISDAPIFLNIPFMNQMAFTAILSFLIIVVISRLEGKGRDDAKGIPLEDGIFKTSPTFNIGAVIVMILATALYAYFW
jgi:SSS family solute:Na+ symporter